MNHNLFKLRKLMTPEDAKGGFEFSIGANIFFAGIFKNLPEPVKWPDIVQPFLMIKNGDVWDIIDERQPMWEDQMKDFTPAAMAQLIITDFNKTLADYGSEGEMTWQEELAHIFQNNLAIVDGQLIIKG